LDSQRYCDSPVLINFEGAILMFRKLFFAVATSILAYSQVSAFCCSFLPEVAESSLDVGIGYRQDRIEWTRQILGQKQKQKWESLNIWEIGVAGKYVTCDDVYFRGYASYGWVSNGHTKDTYSLSSESESCSESSSGFNSKSASSYNEDGSKTKARGHVYDASIALGYQFRWCEESLAFSPLLGYSWHGQHLKGKNHNHSSGSSDSYDCYSDYYSSDYSCTDCSSSESDFSSSESFEKNKYNARWNGPWLGFDVEYAVWCDWTVFFDYEYHWAKYSASNQKFDNGLKAHQRGKNAHGQRFVIGTNWDFCDNWTAALVGEIGIWKAKGKEKIVLGEIKIDDVELEGVLKNRLKDIKWETAAVTLAIGYAF
jgi:hypothetical protein